MTEKKNAPKSLREALLLAQQLLPGVLKDSRNDFHKYKYVSSESMIRDARAALHEAGLVLLPSTTHLAASADMVALGVPAVAVMVWVLEHPATGQAIELSTHWPVVPEKGRPLDKALASARTTGLGYLLRDLLLAPRVDKEDDMDWSGRDRLGLEEAPPPPPAAPPKGEPSPFAAACAYLKQQGVVDPDELLLTRAPDAERMTKAQLAPIVKTILHPGESK
jgi:hypothetical protein